MTAMTDKLWVFCYNYVDPFPFGMVCTIETKSNWMLDNQLLITIVITIIGWSLIVWGWIYNNKKNNLRERRKELRSFIDRIVQQVIELESKAIDYYTKPARSSNKLGFEIKAAQLSLITKIEKLLKSYEGPFKSKDSLITFIDIVTGGDFESAKRKARKYDNESDTFLLSIAFNSTRLIDSLEDDFCKIVESKSF